MIFQLLTNLPDGIFAISAEDLDKAETWCLRYTANEEKIAVIRKEAREDAPKNPMTASILPNFERQSIGPRAEVLPAEVDHRGPIVPAILGLISRAIDIVGIPDHIIDGLPMDDHPGNCFGMFFPEQAPMREAAIVWAHNDTYTVELFFSRSQGFNILKELTWLPREQAELARREMKRVNLPEAGKSRIRFSGRGGQLIVFAGITIAVLQQKRQQLH